MLTLLLQLLSGGAPDSASNVQTNMLWIASTLHPTVYAAVVLQVQEEAISREVTVAYREFEGEVESVSREVTILSQTAITGPEITSREVTVLSEGHLTGPDGISRESTLLAVDGPVLSGTIVFSDLSTPLAAPSVAPITVAETDGTVLYTVSVVVSSSGSFSVPVPNQPIRLSTKVRPWLRRTVVVPQANLTTPQTLPLVSGDIDDDNEVAIGDYAILSAAYGTTFGEPGYSRYADLDADLEVSIGDYAILSANYGIGGDSP